MSFSQVLILQPMNPLVTVTLGILGDEGPSIMLDLVTLYTFGQEVIFIPSYLQVLNPNMSNCRHHGIEGRLCRRA